MNDCLITFRSVTPAQRGESVLRRGGYKCSIRRTPKWMEEQGCGYSLHLNARDVQGAVQLLRKAQLPFRKIYVWQGGDAEELTL